MKVILLMLLLLLCSTQVLTLRCFTCEEENDDCKTETDCPAEAQYCKIVEQAGQIIARTCEEFCESDYSTTCCTEDLC